MASEMSAWDQHKIFDRYIDALLSISGDSALRTQWLDQAAALSRVFNDNPILTKALADPRFGKASKEAVIMDIGGKMKLDKNLTRTLALFVRRGRGSAVFAFLTQLIVRLKGEMGVVMADVTSATALSPAQETELAKSLGKTVELKTSIDPSLLGGLIVQIGSWRMDDSVKGKLERLTRRLKSAA